MVRRLKCHGTLGHISKIAVDTAILQTKNVILIQITKNNAFLKNLRFKNLEKFEFSNHRQVVRF
jgi:hypothetical protein